MSHELQDLQILVTRPDPAGSELCELIKEHGGKAIHFPTISFNPPADLNAFQEAVQQLGEQNWLIFNSPQAVYASIPFIRKMWPEFPNHVQFAAIGKGTAQALKAAGIIAQVYPNEEASSEGLLALPEFQSLKNKKIAIIKGKGGREFLEQALKTRGASVLHVISYERALPQIKVKIDLPLLSQINVIICASFESVQNLKTLIGTASWPILSAIPLIVVSERIKILAQDLGFQTIWVARNASHGTLITILVEKKDELCQIKKMKN